MKLLILGGTQFVGRATAEAALARGHELTLFHRGRTNPDLFAEAEHVHGDRERDLSVLGERMFDVVVDTSGYDPHAVRTSVEALAGARYVFVSTISVYDDFSRGPDESSPVFTAGDGYGELKAACERELPGEALVVRPGLIVGPHDPTYRFTYWVDRLARGGDVVAPEPRGSHVQLIDVRDLADWIVRSIEEKLRGTFNAVGPHEPLSMEELLEGIRVAAGGDARLHWLDADLLQERGLEPWSTLPLWLPDPAWSGHSEVANARAVSKGLTFRPLEETVRDTLAWIRSGAPLFVDRGHPKPGLDAELERELLAA